MIFELKAVPFETAPIEAEPWDASAAVERLRKWASSDGSGSKATIDWEKYARGFAYITDEGDRFGDYKLPHHDIRDGQLVTVKAGVEAAAAAVDGARGSKLAETMRDGDLGKVRHHLAEHYHQWGERPPWQRHADAVAIQEYQKKTTALRMTSRGESVVLARATLSINEFLDLVRVALDAMFPPSQEPNAPGIYVYAEDVFPDAEPPFIVFQQGGKHLSIDFKIEAGVVVLVGEPVPVRRTYEREIAAKSETVSLKGVLIELPDAELPLEFRIFKKGSNPSLKGDFAFDAKSAKEVMAFYKEHGTELSFDYEHASTFEGKDVPGGAPAAGWFVPEVRDGELWATKIRWTEKAADFIKGREYRYFSPTFAAKDGRVTKLISVALTNTPALSHTDPLVAASGKPAQEPTMNEEQMRAILTDYLGKHAKEMTDKMKEGHDKLAKRLDDMEAAHKDSKVKASDDETAKATVKATALIDAHRGHKLTPAEARDLETRLAAKSIDLPYIEAFINAKAAPVTALNAPKPAAEPAVFFTEDEVVKLRADAAEPKMRATDATTLNKLTNKFCADAGDDPAVVAAAWKANCERYEAMQKTPRAGLRLIDTSLPVVEL